MKHWRLAIALALFVAAVACGARTTLDDFPTADDGSVDDVAVVDDHTVDVTVDIFANDVEPPPADAWIDVPIDDATAPDADSDTYADAAVDVVTTTCVSDASVEAGLLTDVVELTTSDSHSCARLSDGGVRCWGTNAFGELGDGTTTVREVAVPVCTLRAAAAQISAAAEDTCALLVDGTIQCWGHNIHGELGDGTMTERLLPTDVATIDGGASKVAAGFDHTCAIVSNAVQCWGANDVGQLGDGTLVPHYTPGSVKSLGATPTAIGAGLHTCALLSTGDIKCWGFGGYGQLGDGIFTTTQPNPTSVTSLGVSPIAIAASNETTCALGNTGSIQCWGENMYGALGDGTLINRDSPVSVLSITNALQVSDSPDHSCAVVTDGGIQCWGRNVVGELGDGTKTSTVSPVNVKSLSGTALQVVVSVTSCALIADGSVQCWGSGAGGKLGNGASMDSTTPVNVLSL